MTSSPGKPKTATSPSSNSVEAHGEVESDEYDSGSEAGSPEEADDGDSSEGGESSEDEDIGTAFLVRGDLAPEEDEDDHPYLPDGEESQEESKEDHQDNEGDLAKAAVGGAVPAKAGTKRTRDDDTDHPAENGGEKRAKA